MDHLMFWAFCSLGYFGFLRTSESTVPGLTSFSLSHHLGVQDIAVGSLLWGAGMVQCWECSPPTNVARVRCPDPASYAGWVCCWFSTLLRELFLWVLRFSPLLKNQHFQFQFDPRMHRHILNELLRTPRCSVGKQITFTFTFFPICTLMHVLRNQGLKDWCLRKAPLSTLALAGPALCSPPCADISRGQGRHSRSPVPVPEWAASLVHFAHGLASVDPGLCEHSR